MIKNKKLSVVLFVAILIVLIGLGVWIGIEVSGTHAIDPSAPSGYTAVYMTSGDIYFGRLHQFPQEYLSDALYVVRSSNQTGQSQLGLAAFKSAFWSPVGDIYLNPAQVLFTAPLRNDSQIIQVIENPSLLNSAGSQPESGQASAPATIPAEMPSTATTTTK